jgi:glycerol-1-phosphate dehydrogenase [NAD(P)+]
VSVDNLAPTAPALADSDPVVRVEHSASRNLASLMARIGFDPMVHLAVITGPHVSGRVGDQLGLARSSSELFIAAEGTWECADNLVERVRRSRPEAVVAIGGGRTIDLAKNVAHASGTPLVVVATSLSNDGICSPVSSLKNAENVQESRVVAMPRAVVVDLALVHEASPRLVRSGVGDVISNVNATWDWSLAAREVGESVDLAAMSQANEAAHAMIDYQGPPCGDGFLVTLFDALVMSGLAMSRVGSSRPASGAEHKIVHAITTLYPGFGTHGELAGVGTLLCLYLRERWMGENGALREAVIACLRRHGLPLSHQAVGLSSSQFAEAVHGARALRASRYTILEHLGLSWTRVREAVEEYAKPVDA